MVRWSVQGVSVIWHLVAPTVVPLPKKEVFLFEKCYVSHLNISFATHWAKKPTLLFSGGQVWVVTVIYRKKVMYLESLELPIDSYDTALLTKIKQRFDN